MLPKKHYLIAQKKTFSIKAFFSKCDRIRSFLKKSLIENFIFCTVPHLMKITMYQRTI